ncbi:MAG: hypothetical protein ACK4LQ_13640 [Pararhodobacter sp.]
MRFSALAAAALLALPACMGGGTGNTGSTASIHSGVGFGDYQRYLREREAAQRQGVPYSVPPESSAQPPRPAQPSPAAMAPGPARPAGSQGTIAATTLPATTLPATGQAAPSAARQATGAPLAAPMAALPPASQPQPPAAPAFGTSPVASASSAPRPAGLSDEQDFNAVAARESIESDRERLAHQRAQYQVVEVTSVPDASVRSGPNVIEYALGTNHPVGAQQHRRMNPLRWSRWESACLQFHNQDAAQEAFLAAGGPERDPGNLDPDGDGYACWWDPTPIRQAVRAGQ